MHASSEKQRVGVQPLAYKHSRDHVRGTSVTTETSSVHSVVAKLPSLKEAAFTVDWLENVDDRWFLWPHHINRETVRSETRSVGPAGLKVAASETAGGGDRSCVALRVGGLDVNLCSRWMQRAGQWRKPGCLIYLGTPDEETLKRVRNVLSFSLGMFLISLGHTIYSHDWEIVSFKSVSPYSIDERVFDLPVMPPAPLASRSLNEIEPETLSRLANALYSTYDELGFADLNWGFWHARCAAPHIAPVHFGAIIEALLSRCLQRYPDVIKRKIVGVRRTSTYRRSGPH